MRKDGTGLATTVRTSLCCLYVAYSHGTLAGYLPIAASTTLLVCTTLQRRFHTARNSAAGYFRLFPLLPRPHIGGGLHSLTTTVLLTECSIEYFIGLLPILHTVPSDRMPSHIRHVSQPPSPIWIITVAPPPPADTHRLLPSSHTDLSSSASTDSPAGSLAATDYDRVLILTITVADAIRRGCCHPPWLTPSPRPCRLPTSPSRRAPSR